MAAEVFSNASKVLEAKFKGCMIGALMGDCVGCPFEFNYNVSKVMLGNFLTKLLDSEWDQHLPCTDDTEMAVSIASSLVEKREVDPQDIAKRFVDKYYNQPHAVVAQRCYGGHVVKVFRALRENDCSDVFSPAKNQFNGGGSFGNGAAMRIAPVALFGYNKGEQFLVEAVQETSFITHTHPLGYKGALLQCLAISAALELDPSKPLDPVLFINSLQAKMEAIETNHEKPYCESLQKIKGFYLEKREEISPKEIAECLGNDETALLSVPTAIYSFLRGLKPLKDYENTNPFLRTLFVAISIGGDADTIACMAGGIAGAYYGVDAIPEAMQKRCEYIDEVTELADRLFEMTQKT